MLIDRIYLRNYRVFEQELELFLPPGLVGVYGANGAGKSTLLESILWALWGRARTPKELVPTAGTRGECIAEISFEQEGHIYLVRRSISGAAATVKAEAHCDGQAMAQGARDTSRYIHSVLGMDDAAFRASVFAEQKQLAAFSSHTPAERRKLVLSLLGVTPLDTARDQARSDARDTGQRHAQLKAMLPDVTAATIASADAEARATAAETAANDDAVAAGAAQARLDVANELFGKLDLVRQEHERLVLEGKAARAQLDAAAVEASTLTSELASLSEAEGRLLELQPLAAQLAAAELKVGALDVLAAAARELAALPDDPEPAPPDEESLGAASQRAMDARSALGSAEAVREAALSEVEKARGSTERAGALSSEAECPLCGQALGNAFAEVQAHRASELEAATLSLAAAEVALTQASAQARASLGKLETIESTVVRARKARSTWEQAQARRSVALQQFLASMDRFKTTAPNLAGSLGSSPTVPEITLMGQEAADELAICRGAQEQVVRLTGRLERRADAEKALRNAEDRAVHAGSLVDTLRGKVKDLGYDPTALADAKQALQETTTSAQEVIGAAATTRMEAVKARAQATAEAANLERAREQHSKLKELESASLHLSRTADLLNAFRNTVVASVGPRLAVQAAELFDELTDGEYDRLEVDADTFGLQILDGGVAYDLDRFSGSEIDLANLALRVAISEHVRFQSGGSVGLLVLDEVFGPLDEERKARMLLALERLRGRFRQVLVVTHSADIKQNLPNSITVSKLRGRRATAQLSDGASGIFG